VPGAPAPASSTAIFAEILHAFVVAPLTAEIIPVCPAAARGAGDELCRCWTCSLAASGLSVPSLRSDAAASSSAMAACNWARSNPDEAAGCMLRKARAVPLVPGAEQPTHSYRGSERHAGPTETDSDDDDSAQMGNNLTMLPPLRDSSSCC